MNKMNLVEELANRPLLCDGAMGTQLMIRGLESGTCGEMWNLEKPELVEEIHRAYREAGCDLVTTNTFGGCEPALMRHNHSDKVREINTAAAEVARRCGRHRMGAGRYRAVRRIPRTGR